MALNDRFAEYHAQAATANYRHRGSLKNRASSVNRKLVQEMAYRPSVMDALSEGRSIPRRIVGKQQEKANGTIKTRLDFRNKRRCLSVHDRLGYVKERSMPHRRDYRSGVSPLLRDQLGFEEPDFEKKHHLNQRENFCIKDNFEEKRQSSGDDIYVEVNINESEPKIDMDDIHFQVEFKPNQPRAYPTGMFNFYHGIRYYESEIFIWVTECNPIDLL